MNQDMSILELVRHASFVVQLVMLLLLAGSIASWTAIFRKLRALRQVTRGDDEFERDFWSGKSLTELFAAAARRGWPMNGSAPLPCSRPPALP